MKFGFTDWRLLDQSPVDLTLDKRYVYYIHARAWALKGWLGGTHSYTTFWSKEHNEWLVIELSDNETLDIQDAKVYYIWDNVAYSQHSPTISNRNPAAKWFGATPIIVGRSKNEYAYDDFEQLAKEYPLKTFHLAKRNCNTFTSYLVRNLRLDIKRPIRSIGFRSKRFWKKYDT